MSEEYKMQRIKEYLIFHIKNSKEQRELLDYLDQLQQKEKIIKEVREKIESVQMLGLRSGKTLIATLLNDILEILDKEVIKSETMEI